MRPRQILKIITDICMTVILLFLMAYSLAGEVLHEWLGIAMFVLFILHHILNSAWSRNIFKAKYTPFRMLQTVVIVLALLTMLGSMVSGIVLSRHALSFLPIAGGQAWARTVHMLSAYWGFVFISVHLGLHWSMMMAMAEKMWGKPSAIRRWTARTVGVLIAGYGMYAFIQREIGAYMLLRSQFVFFDFDEPLIFFILDYVAVMGLFVFIGHYLSEGVKKIGKR